MREIRNYRRSMDKKQEDLNKLLDEGGPDIDTLTLRTMAELELSDLIWEHHQSSGFVMSGIMIAIQLLFVVFNVILLCLGFHTGITVSIVTTTILLLVIINNYIHTKTWNIAKDRAKTINKIVAMLAVNAKLECLREIKDKYGIDVSEKEE